MLYAWALILRRSISADKATRVFNLFVMQMHYSLVGDRSSTKSLRFRLARASKYEVYMQLMVNFDFNFSALGIKAVSPEDVKFEIRQTRRCTVVMRWTYAGRLPGSGGGAFDGPNAGDASLVDCTTHALHRGRMKISIDRPEPGGTACDSGMLLNSASRRMSGRRVYQLWN